MRRLDPAIERLFKEGGDELVFEVGSGATLRVGDQHRNVFRQALNGQQVTGAFAELVSGPAAEGFPQEGATTFDYESPAGRVTVRFEKHGDDVRARVSPAGVAKAAATAPIVSPREITTSFTKLFAEKPAARPVPEVKREEPRVIVDKRGYKRGPPKEAMEELLALMVELRASDLHATSRIAPMLRIDGDMTGLADYGPIEPARLGEMVRSIMPDRNRAEFDARHDTDFAYELPSGRFRMNAFEDRAGPGLVVRQIATKVPTAEELALPQAVVEFCALGKGLVLVTGPTGSGKSTTLAAMVDVVNATRDDHIITIEDPIEFVHPHKRCLVNQREVAVNTDSFKTALRAALREDPDVLLVGELRDLETIAIAVETAETGHLVFGTLHTTSAAGTIDRVIDQFPADRQEQIRMMLAESLRGVVSQVLCKKIGGGRIAAQEILVVNGAVSNLIREGKTFQIPSVMQTSRNLGMVTLNDALYDLVKRKLVEPAEALRRSVNKADLKVMLERAGHKN